MSSLHLATTHIDYKKRVVLKREPNPIYRNLKTSNSNDISPQPLDLFTSND